MFFKYLRMYGVWCFVTVLFLSFLVGSPYFSSARNVHSYSDTISDSKPNVYANHTFSFVPQTALPASGYIEIEPPSGFEIVSAATFAERNVEMLVGGIARDSGAVIGPTTDRVEIFPGAPGMIRYTLNPTTGIAAGSLVEIKIGNHTSLSQNYSVSFSTTTGTTTVPADIFPIKNAPVEGTHKVRMNFFGTSEEMFADFHVAVVRGVGVGPADTTEEVPPFRFNGAPTGEVSGTTFNVELSLETDELAVCKYGTASGTAYLAMPQTFSVTGLIVHSVVVPVATGTTNTYFVRCIDDEGNFNTDDYEITFISLPPPTGNPTTGSTTNGTGTGTGNSGGRALVAVVVVLVQAVVEAVGQALVVAEAGEEEVAPRVIKVTVSLVEVSKTKMDLIKVVMQKLLFADSHFLVVRFTDLSMVFKQLPLEQGQMVNIV